MKITKLGLWRLVNEEYSRAIVKRRKGLHEERVHPAYRDELNECSAEALLEFAKAYRSMGDAVAEQLHELMGDDQADLNPNAVDLIKKTLGGVNEEIDSAIAVWEEYYNGEPGGSKNDDEWDV